MKPCLNCGTQFVAKHHSEKHCSDQCKKQYSRTRADAARAKAAQEKFANADPSEYVECGVCGFRGAEITKHVIKEHGMTSQEYRQKFGHATKCQKMIDRVSGANNPGYQHGGKLSPFSKNFVAYEGMTDEEKSRTVTELGVTAQASAKANGNSNTSIEYWTTRCYSLEDAKAALSERQSTFSLEKCIEKFGEIEGRLRWQVRQDNWQDTLNSKSIDEIASINSRKVVNNNYKQFGNDTSTSGVFYIIRYDSTKLKIGVTSKDSVMDRYTPMHLAGKEILLEMKLPSLTDAFSIEQTLKLKYANTTIKGDYGNEFGWTEIFHNVDHIALVEEAKLLAVQ